MDKAKVEELKKKKLERMKKQSKEINAAGNKKYLKKKKQLKLKEDLRVKALAESTPYVPGESKRGSLHIGGRMKMRPNSSMFKQATKELMMDMAAQNVDEQLKKEYEQTKEEITGEVKEAKSIDGDSTVSSA